MNTARITGTLGWWTGFRPWRLEECGYRTGCFTNSPIIDQYHNLVRGFEVIERVWADSAVITEERPA